MLISFCTFTTQQAYYKLRDAISTEFFTGSVLNKKNIAKAHKLLSKHIVATHQQRKIRIHNMYVPTPDGKIEHVAALLCEVEKEMQKLYTDIDVLIDTN